AANGAEMTPGVKRVWVRVVDSAGNATTASDDIMFATTAVGEPTVAPSPVDLEAYPNPAHALLFVHVNGAAVAEPRMPSIVLTDAIGRVVMQRDLAPGRDASFDVSWLPPGVYTVRAARAGGVITIVR